MAFLCKCICVSSFCLQKFLRPIVFWCKRLVSDSKRFLACRTADSTEMSEPNFEEMRKVDQCSDEMKTDYKNLLRWHARRDGMRWEELRWGEKSSYDLRLDEVWSAKCKCEVWSAGCEEYSLKREESLPLVLHCAGVARTSCSWTTTLQQLRTKHARTGLAGA